MISQYQNEQELLSSRAALICSVIANVNRDPKKRNKPFTIQDFMPRKPKPKLSDEQMMERATLITQMLGGEIV